MQYLLFLIFSFLTVNVYEVIAQTRCQTPNQEDGRCVPIKTCKILYDAVLSDDPEVIRFLRASQCGFSGQPLVCCGTTASYGPKPTSRPLVKRPDLLPDLNDCGDSPKYRILNGQDTGIDEFPWTALIKYRNDSGFEQFSCGGTLISRRYILTAAHCVVGRILTAVGTPKLVRLGEWNTDTEIDCVTIGTGRQICNNKPEDINIEEITSHNEYVDGSLSRYHDIALIRLGRAAQYSDFIKPVCLPQSNDQVTVGQRLTVVGWGRTETGRYSSIKQKLDVPVISESQCSSVFRTAGVNVQGTQLCAGGEENKDSCSGDSGGPLLGEKNAQFFLVGAVSFGAQCGRKGWPGIYTRISNYRDWIEGNLED